MPKYSQSNKKASCPLKEIPPDNSHKKNGAAIETAAPFCIVWLNTGSNRSR